MDVVNALPAVLAPYRAAIEAAALPAVRLAPPAPASGAAAQYGGTPLVPPGATWPRGPDGPYRFVGQLDFAAVHAQAGAAARGLPDDGILAMFGDPRGWPGSGREGDGWRLLYTPRSADAVPLPVPGPPPPPRRAFPLSGPELRPGAAAATSFPTYDDTVKIVAIPDDAEDAWDAYFAYIAADEREAVHQLLGHAGWIQYDARVEVESVARGANSRAGWDGPDAAAIQAEALRWRLVWQVDSDREAGFMWGDLGRVYVLMKEDDLAARRFDRAWLTGDCY
jgi:uncharacterized protein YwqG